MVNTLGERYGEKDSDVIEDIHIQNLLGDLFFGGAVHACSTICRILYNAVYLQHADCLISEAGLLQYAFLLIFLKPDPYITVPGTVTSSDSLYAFVKLLCEFPGVQNKMAAEIWRELGPEALALASEKWKTALLQSVSAGSL